jgi:RNA polymerase sigma-70 factor, ECF subfamily
MTTTESTSEDFARLADPFRRELLQHCYRMLGSIHDAEDLVQETLLRAWRAFGTYDAARASMRTWLYRIATNACLTALDQRRRRPLPSGLAAPAEGATSLELGSEVAWLQPIPDHLLPQPTDPAALVASRVGVRLALITALQHLPARQRAVLILREVMAWSAAEVATILETTPAAVNSALQRARAQLNTAAPLESEVIEPQDSRWQDLLDRYMRAFENADVDSLIGLLREDVTLEMPPFRTWFSGRDTIEQFFRTHVFATPDAWRLTSIRANGAPAAATYLRGADGTHRPHSLQVLSVAGNKISRIVAFQDARLFAVFSLHSQNNRPPRAPGLPRI